jgi:hypothetical protein
MPSESYLNNPNLKSAFVKYEYTKHELSEFVKCAQDPVYFIKTYVKIINIDEGLIDFALRDYQEDMVNLLHNNRFVITLQPRQTGKTITSAMYLMYHAIFNASKNIAIIANKDKRAKGILHTIKLAYENLPKFLQQGVLVWNKGDIELENGSKISASATSSSSIRGDSINILLLDELSFVPQNIQEEFFASVYPTISSGKTSKIFISSTPLGFEMFHRLWKDASEGRNAYVAYEVKNSGIPGRDTKWEKETIAAIGMERYRREYLCEFMGSQNTLIDPTKLSSLTYSNPIYSKSGLILYEEPDPDKIYAMTVDCAHGKGLDASAFHIFDITKYPYRQVGTYRNNTISPLVFPNVIYDLATKFNEAYVLVEVNDVGYQVATILHNELEYDAILLCASHGRNGQQISTGFGKNVQYGVRTTPQVKRIGCVNLKRLIEDDKIILQDFATIIELSSFTLQGGTYKADPGKHDDLCMALVLFAWLVNQAYFNEMLEKNLYHNMYQDQLEELEEELAPIGILGTFTEPDMDHSFVDSEGTVWHNA